MWKIKFKADKAGNFYSKVSFKLVAMSLQGPGPVEKKVFLKLLAPKDAHIKLLTLTINKKTVNVRDLTAKLISAGPFPFVAGENVVSFDGSSDTLDISHEIHLTPQLLE